MPGRRGPQPGTLRTLYFHSWSPEMAYDLGYIFADGTLSCKGVNSKQLTLECKTEDESIILGIRERLNSHHHIKRRGPRVSNGRKRGPATIVQITNTALCNQLLTLGVMPNKSNRDDSLPVVPEEFQGHFTRGFTDGDGVTCQSGNQLEFIPLGNITFLTGLSRLISDRTGVPYREPKLWAKSDHTYYIQWAANEDIERLIWWLYPDGDYPFLDRKWDEFRKFALRRGLTCLSTVRRSQI